MSESGATELVVQEKREVDVVTSADIQVHVEMVESKLEAERVLHSLALRVTRPEDWDELGGKPYLNDGGCTRVANLIGISSAIEFTDVEHLDNGHTVYNTTGRFWIGPPYSLEHGEIGSRSSQDPFFSTKNKQAVAPKDINMKNVQKGAFTNCFGRGIRRITGMKNINPQELNEALYGKKGKISSTVEYKAKTMPFGDYKDKPIVDVPDAELKKIKNILFSNIKKYPSHAKSNQDTIKQIDSVLHDRESEQTALSASAETAVAPSEVEGNSKEGDSPRPESDDDARLEHQWADFLAFLQDDDPEIKQAVKVVLEKFHIFNVSELPDKFRSQFMLSVNDEMKPKKGKKR